MYKYEIDISHFPMLVVDEIMGALYEYGMINGNCNAQIDFANYIINIECKTESDFENVQNLINKFID